MKREIDPGDVRVFRGGGGYIRAGILAAVVGLIAVVIGWFVDPHRTALAYLAAFVTCISTCIGALIFLAIVHAMNAKWPVVLRRLVEATTAPLLVLALLFIPIGVSAGEIYPWVDPVSDELSHHTRLLIEKKHPWLTVEFFWARSAFYLVTWIVLAWLLRRWSARQDHESARALKLRQRYLSAATLPLLALTLTFAAFDWVMSLAPSWYSTVFGIYVFAGGFVASIAVLTIATMLAERGRWLLPLLTNSHYYALGRLLFAFVVFWAYIAFFQLMLIWIANRPEEVAWYIARTEHGWQWLALTILLLHFVVPFFSLLPYAIKWRPRALSIVAGIIGVAHWIEVHWMVVPAGRVDWVVHWVDFGAIMLVGGTCLAFAVWRQRGRPMAPRYDASLSKGASYDSA